MTPTSGLQSNAKKWYNTRCNRHVHEKAAVHQVRPFIRLASPVLSTLMRHDSPVSLTQAFQNTWYRTFEQDAKDWSQSLWSWVSPILRQSDFIKNVVWICARLLVLGRYGGTRQKDSYNNTLRHTLKISFIWRREVAPSTSSGSEAFLLM